MGWAGGATSKSLPPKLTKAEVLNRWDRHGRDCAACKKVQVHACLVLQSFFPACCPALMLSDPYHGDSWTHVCTQLRLSEVVLCPDHFETFGQAI